MHEQNFADFYGHGSIWHNFLVIHGPRKKKLHIILKQIKIKLLKEIKILN